MENAKLFFAIFRVNTKPKGFAFLTVFRSILCISEDFFPNVSIMITFKSLQKLKGE